VKYNIKYTHDPTVNVANLWDFYNPIGYDYATKKYIK